LVVVVFFFAAGDVAAEADVDFLVVEDVFFVLVDAADVVTASSFFWVWQPRNAVNVSAVIKVKTDVFIMWLSLTLRECRSVSPRASMKIVSFFPSKL
jgi:hypothetical protein